MSGNMHERMAIACKDAGLVAPYLVIKECAGVAMDVMREKQAEIERLHSLLEGQKS